MNPNTFSFKEPNLYVVVVGGANIDIKLHTYAPSILGTSNPGKYLQTLGGVGRNIAENLARLNVGVHLLSVVGDDALGMALVQQTALAGVNMDTVTTLANAQTGTYTAVLNSNGELVIAVAAMDIMQQLRPALIRQQLGLLAGASWVVADGNLPAETLKTLLQVCQSAGVAVIYEPVSVPKAARLLPCLQAGLAPFAITPNLAELAALTGQNDVLTVDVLTKINQAVKQLQAQGIAWVWVRLGERGSLLYTETEVFELAAQPAVPIAAVPIAAVPIKVVDVTGAGDSMLAAFLAALLRGYTPQQATQVAHLAAALTIASPFTVRPDLTWPLLQQTSGFPS